MTFQEIKEDIKDTCRACIDVKTWFKDNKPKMNTSTKISSNILYHDPILKDPISHKVSSSGVICPPDARELGRSTWSFLHSTAAYLPETPNESQKQQFSNLLLSISHLYPCRNCAEHLQAYLQVHPITLDSKKSISRWLCNFHNEVNLMLGKESFDCEKVDERWKTGPTDDSCN